jgi:hypothetical protein
MPMTMMMEEEEDQAEVRLLCGFIILEELLKELCSHLFAREKIKSLPIKPEGYYMEPKRLATVNVNSASLIQKPKPSSHENDKPVPPSSPPPAEGVAAKEEKQLLSPTPSMSSSMLASELESLGRASSPRSINDDEFLFPLSPSTTTTTGSSTSGEILLDSSRATATATSTVTIEAHEELEQLFAEAENEMKQLLTSQTDNKIVADRSE